MMIVPMKRARSNRMEALVGQLEMAYQRVSADVTIQVMEAYEGIMVARKGLDDSLKALEDFRRRLKIRLLAQRWGLDDDPVRLLDLRIKEAMKRRRCMEWNFRLQRAYLDLVAAVGGLSGGLKFIPWREEKGAYVFPWEQRKDTSCQYKALWVWKTQWLTDGRERGFFLDFCEARGFYVVFLFTPKDALVEDPDTLRAFLREAHARGIAVQALNGSSVWALPEGKGEAEEFLEALVAFQRSSPPEERFDAVHLDVEPHSTPKWDEPRQRASIIDHYLSLLRVFRERLNREGISLVVDIPPWYDNVYCKGGRLLELVLKEVDGAAVMNYRPGGKGVVKAVGEEVEAASRLGKSLWVGLGSEPAFLPPVDLEQRPRSLDELIVAIQRKYCLSETTVEGVAIHDAYHYERLLLDAALGAGENDSQGVHKEKGGYASVPEYEMRKD
jgi:hypothetical protein